MEAMRALGRGSKAHASQQVRRNLTIGNRPPANHPPITHLLFYTASYRNGRIQHIGVVLGLGGHAGHFGAMAVDAEPGWHARNLVTHEISAVTGACLAVQRWKFERVGGFDAIHLPIDLNDVDLCLRLAEHDWSALLDPEICLLHDESASRGRGTFRRLAVYASQRRHFQARWRAWIRDDPFFHPGLSLYCREAALS